MASIPVDQWALTCQAIIITFLHQLICHYTSHSSHATSDISNALTKPQTKSIDLMEFSTGPQLDESNGVQSD